LNKKRFEIETVVIESHSKNLEIIRQLFRYIQEELKNITKKIKENKK